MKSEISKEICYELIKENLFYNNIESVFTLYIYHNNGISAYRIYKDIKELSNMYFWIMPNHRKLEQKNLDSIVNFLIKITLK